MIRYHFDVTTGKWVVQLLKFGIFWMSVSNKEFDDIIAAYRYVDETGLLHIYAVQEPPRNRYMATALYGQGAR